MASTSITILGRPGGACCLSEKWVDDVFASGGEKSAEIEGGY
jgi:hypothetical protein